MKKDEFAKQVKETLSLTSKAVANDVVDKLSDLIARLMKEGEEVQFGCLGKFVTTMRPERKCKNFHTGEEIIVPPKKVVKLKQSAKFKKLINE